MARTALPIITVIPQQSIPIVGQLADIANGNMFLNDGTSLVHVYNGNAGVCTVTVYAVPDDAGRTGTSADAVALPNASIGYQYAMDPDEVRLFGPFKQAWWNQTSEDVGYVYINFAVAAGNGVVVKVIDY